MRQIEVVIEHGLFDTVSVCALSTPELPVRNHMIEGKLLIQRFQLRTRWLPKIFGFQMFKYVEWAWRIVASTRQQSIDVIDCHRIGSLPMGVFIKFLTKSKLVYQAHELESEVTGTTSSTKAFYKILEKLCLRYVDGVVVVSDSIADWYEANYDIKRPLVLRNIPKTRRVNLEKAKLFRHRFGISMQDLLFIYVGGLDRDRFIPELIEIFSRIGSPRHVLFMGYGECVDEIIKASHQFDNIHYFPSVPHDEVVNITAAADVGLVTFDNKALSRFLTIPNKFFECLLAGIPVIVPENLELKRFLDQFDCGWVVDQQNPIKLNDLISNIDRSDISRKTKNVAAAKASFNIQIEYRRLIELYRSLINAEPAVWPNKS